MDINSKYHTVFNYLLYCGGKFPRYISIDSLVYAGIDFCRRDDDCILRHFEIYLGKVIALDMEVFIRWFIDELFLPAFGVLNSVVFSGYGVEVTFLQILSGFIILSMVVTHFWKGALG